MHHTLAGLLSLETQCIDKPNDIQHFASVAQKSKKSEFIAARLRYIAYIFYFTLASKIDIVIPNKISIQYHHVIIFAYDTNYHQRAPNLKYTMLVRAVHTA
jgi:hypothetical protein